MDRERSSEVARVLCRDLTTASRSEDVEEGAVTVWLSVRAALEPIIGPRGVAALYSRSVHLTSAEHPWLAEVPSSPSSAMDLPALRASLERRDVPDGSAACIALISTFCGTLASLVGDSLVERLLTVPPPPSTDTGESRDGTS